MTFWFFGRNDLRRLDYCQTRHPWRWNETFHETRQKQFDVTAYIDDKT